MSKSSLNSTSPFINEVITSFQTAGLNETTQHIYIRWVREFIDFFGKSRHPKDIKDSEIAMFINTIGTDRNLSYSSQNQALSALVHVYRYVIKRPIGELEALLWAKKPRKVPVIYSREEITSFLGHLSYPVSLVVKLSLCTGLRLSEASTLTIGNVDFNRGVINVIQGKHKKDREVILPAILRDDLREAIKQARSAYLQDMQYAKEKVSLVWHDEKAYPVKPARFERQQYVFTSSQYQLDEKRKVLVRLPLNRKYISKKFKIALGRAGIEGKGSFHSLRHTFASYAYHHGTNLRELQLLLGHSNLETTMIYTHLLPESAETPSPLDQAGDPGSPDATDSTADNSYPGTQA